MSEPRAGSTATNGRPGRRVDVRDATIKTAAVEVKTLTVSGKQVTLAVFRQLQEEALLDPDTLQLRGLPWGTVNYHWKECCIGGEHLWVVWQTGTELRRASVPRRRVTPRQVECRRLVLALDNLWALVLSLDQPPSAVYADGRRESGVEFGGTFFPTQYLTAQAIGLAWGFSEYGTLLRPASAPAEFWPARAGELVRKAAPPAGIDAPPLETRQQRVEAVSLCGRLRQERVDEDAAISEALTRRWAELSALDQLFIAV